ncbi:unnamed protein product [Mytilus coruscus]|uniref:DDE-1 domain-containing protein n=1 Tax=Mytilus coruscus TaxID=42192 RepID=A0A6J8E0Z3_MYTCO|nr:unnamed protein product [Mytilus coruscus]
MLNPLKVGRYFVDLHRQLTTYKLSPTEVWNMDETGLSLADEGTRSVPGRTGNSREGVTILPCINAAGEKIPPLVIVKGKTERSLRNCDAKRPQLLVLDSHHSHETLGLLELAFDNNIIILAMPAHTTNFCAHWIAPSFGPFKREYDQVWSEYMSSSVDNVVNKLTFPELMTAAYDKSFRRANIVSGFESTGIYEWNPLAIPASAFAPASAVDDPDIVADPTEMELPGNHHPLQWVIRKVASTATNTSAPSGSTTLSFIPSETSCSPSVVPVSVPQTSAAVLSVLTSANSFSIASTATSFPIISNSEVIPSTQSSYEIIPTYFSSPDHTGDNSRVTNSQTLINFNDFYDITVTSDSDPFMSAAILDNDAAEILGSLTDSPSTPSTMDTVVELDNSQWSGTWNDELDRIFSVKSSGKTPKKLKTGTIITSHRLLTSQEIIDRKRKELENKETKEHEKKLRKLKREEVKINKQKQKKEKQVKGLV